MLLCDHSKSRQNKEKKERSQSRLHFWTDSKKSCQWQMELPSLPEVLLSQLLEVDSASMIFLSVENDPMICPAKIPDMT